MYFNGNLHGRRLLNIIYVDQVLRILITVFCIDDNTISFFQGNEDFSNISDNSVVIKLKKILMNQPQVEESLSVLPKKWWPGFGAMSETLSSACCIIILIIFTSIAPRPSLKFCTNTLLLILSKMMNNPKIHDFHFSNSLEKLLTLIHSYPKQKVSASLQSLTFSLHSELKSLLIPY